MTQLWESGFGFQTSGPEESETAIEYDIETFDFNDAIKITRTAPIS